METVTVLYVVGRIAPTSVPLEVAQFIQDPQIKLHTVGFYETPYPVESLDGAPVCIGATSRYDIEAVFQLYQYICSIRPDVLHVHHTVPAFWASVIGKGRIRAHLVRSEHNDYSNRSFGQRAIDTVSQGLADLVLCNSKNTYRSIKDFRKRLLGGKWRVVHNGVNIERIDRANSSTPPFEEQYDGVTIGSVGRLIEVKNYRRLIRAFARILERGRKDVRLVLIGEGEARKTLEAEVRRFGMEEQVVFTGEVDRDKVYAGLHALDLFAIPSLSEGFCNAVVEAMAASLPVLCSDIQTLHEVVGDVATYVNPRDSNQMADGLCELLREGRKGWRRRGENARERAQTHFTVQRTAEAYAESYLEVVNQ